MDIKKGTLLKQDKLTGFVCDFISKETYPISVIWDGDNKHVYRYNEKFLIDNNIQIITKEEYIKLLNK